MCWEAEERRLMGMEEIRSAVPQVKGCGKGVVDVVFVWQAVIDK